MRDLEEKIIKASKQYYSGRAVISDSEFDDMIEDLRRLDPKNGLLTRVGHGYIPRIKERVKHSPNCVGTLPKVQHYSPRAGDYFSPKYDGLCLAAYYESGELKRILTRGDGVFGIDVTSKVSVPRIISDKAITCIVGEGVISIKNFEDHLKGKNSNPRNAASGLINSYENKGLELVEFIAFKFISDDKICSKPQAWYPGPQLDIYFDYIDPNKIRSNCPYPTDGIIVNGFTAWKQGTNSVEAVVETINWKVSKHGRLIPVVQVKPIELYGTKVRNVAAFNYKYVKDSKLGVGSVINVTKANEIIPYITSIKSTTKFEDIKQCFDCKAPLKERGVDMICSNLCGSVSLIHKFFDIFIKVDSLGYTRRNHILKRAKVKSIEDIPKFKEYSPSSQFEAILVNEIIKQFNEPFDIRSIMLLFNIEGLGYANSVKMSKVVREVAKGIRSFQAGDLVQNRESILNAIGNMPEVPGTLKYLLENFNFSTVVADESSADMKTVVLTGKFSVAKRLLENKLNDLGFSQGKLSKDSILICNDKFSQSAKMRKAVSLGIDIYSEVDFFAKFGG